MFLCLCFILFQTSAQAYNTETVKDGYATVIGDKKYDLIKGVFMFPADKAINGKFIDLPARFFYSDGFFEEDPYKYNPSIARHLFAWPWQASIQMQEKLARMRIIQISLKISSTI